MIQRGGSVSLIIKGRGVPKDMLAIAISSVKNYVLEEKIMIHRHYVEEWLICWIHRN